MSNIYGYKDCKVIIYDLETKHTVANTKIVEHDKTNHTIVINRSGISGNLPDKVSILIFCENLLYEYLGTLRKSGTVPHLAEIALYKGKTKEERTAQRYTVNVPTVIEHLIIASKKVPLPKPMDVTVVNLSIKGCLIKGAVSLLNINTTFQLVLNCGEEPLSVQTTVTRITILDQGLAEYGCEFKFAKQQQATM